MQTDAYAKQKRTEALTVHILWMASGLGCDGESVAMTAASSPSLKELIGQCIPGMPRVVLHNPMLAYEVGEDFMQAWYDAEEDRLSPFVLVLEGAIPNERVNQEGYWSGLGTNPLTGQPVTTNEWVDRLAPKAAAVVALGTCATYGGIPAMKNNPTGAMGLPDYLGWKWRARSGLPIVCLPGCPAQPDNITETLMYVVLHLGASHRRRRWTSSFARAGCSAARHAKAAAGPASPSSATSPPSTARTPAAW